MGQLFDIIWSNNSPSGKLIILLIIVVGAVAISCVKQHLLRYQRSELKWLNQVRGRLRQALQARPAAQQTEEDKKQLVQLVNLRELSEAIPTQSLIGDRLTAIAKMKAAQVKVNVNVLQQMTALNESSKMSLAIPGYTVGLAMLLGLLGTFIGLALMAQEIQIDLKVIDPDQLSKTLGRIIKGLQTAFSTTLVGLACSICVSAFNFRLGRVQSAFYDHLERFTAEELLPVTVPAVEDETVLEKVTLQLDQHFSRLEEITKDHTQNVEHLMAMEEAFGKIINNIRELTHREANRPGQELTGEMTTVLRDLTQVNGAIVKLTESIPRILMTFQQSHQETLKRVDALLKAQRESTSRAPTYFGSEPQPPVAPFYQQLRSGSPRSSRHSFNALSLSDWQSLLTDWDTARLLILGTIGGLLVLSIYWLLS